MRRALETSNDAHPFTASSLHLLGSYYQRKVLLDDAEIQFRKCLAMKAEVRSCESYALDRALKIREQGNVMQSRASIADAEKLQDRCLSLK